MKQIMIAFISFLFGAGVFAQEKAAATEFAQANNPLANMTSVGLQNYYIPKLTNTSADAYMNSAWIRFAKPLVNGKLLMRVSAPIITIAVPDINRESNRADVSASGGLGDINLLLAYNFVSNLTTTLGGGIILTSPTATKSLLGTGKWQGGLSLIGFSSKSAVLQYGALLTWQMSFAGDQNRSKTNNGAFQYFAFWQLGQGYYFRSTPVWAFDFKNSQYNIPFALGIGKVIKVNSTLFNLFVEPQYTMLSKGIQPQFQVFGGINLQLMN